MALIQWKQISSVLDGHGDITGSLNLYGSQTISGDLTVDGTVSAQAYHSEVISASILYESGSSKFGNTSDDVHSFTGSLNLTGSILLNGVGLITSPEFTDFSSSVANSIDSIVFTDITDLNAFTSSANGRLTSLESFSSSLDASFATDTQLTDVSSSLAASISSISTDFDDITNKPELISSSASIVDIPGKKIQYSNVYSTEGDLPNASQYHGMFAHVHSTGAGYFAHAGTWIKLANSGSVSNLVDSVSSSLASSISSISTDFNDITNKPTLVSSSAQIDLSQATGVAANAISASYAVSASYEIITELSSSHAVNADSASFIEDSFISASAVRSGFGSTDYNGNRIVSNTLLPDLFSNTFNAGTTGSVVEFLDKIFFPNSSPTITSSPNLNISEYTVGGTTISTLTATDPEAQSLSWSLAGSYTANKVSITNSGVLSLVSYATASINTVDRGDGVLAHPIPVNVTDSFGSVGAQTVYLRVNPNVAPVFRQGSTGGSIINSYTTSRNENATSGEVVRLYFTDDESDTITITSSSITGNHFTVNKYANYVSIVQATSSLDYENTSSYSFSITAADEHHVAGLDNDSVTQLPVTINVTDNVIPTINNQTLTGFSEDENDGVTYKDIAASDPEGDTIVFTNFTLNAVYLGPGIVSPGYYTGTSHNNPDEDPFQMSSSGRVTRISNRFINSDLINKYEYNVTVSDNFNTTSNTALVTIEIADDVAPSVSSNSPFYIIESALTNDHITNNTSGQAGTRAQFTSNQSVTWEVNPTNLFSIDSSGRISLTSDISGSYSSGATLNGSVTGSNSFGTITQQVFNVSVTDNVAPSQNRSQQTSNYNTNGARSGNTLDTITFSDPNGDNIDHSTFTFSGDAGLGYYFSAGTYFITASSDLSAGNYNYTVSIKDEYGDDTLVANNTIAVQQASTGNLSANGSFYIIESALNGTNIVTNSNGRTGTQAQLSVSYSPNYNSQAVQTWTSSNNQIAIDSNGRLSLDSDVSGSSSSGDTLTSTINWTDQYGNTNLSGITIAVTENAAPTATIGYYSNNFNTNAAINGANMISVNISDTENDTPFNLTLSGTNSANFTPVSQNGNNSSYIIQANGALTAGSYSIDINITDAFGKSRTYSRTISIDQSLDYGKALIYTLSGNRVLGLGSNFNGTTGINSTSAGTPTLISSTSTNSPYNGFQSGSLGNSSFSVGGGTVTRRADIDGSETYDSLDELLRQEGSFTAGNVQEQIFILVPANSDLEGVPTAIGESFSGTTSGEYVLNVNPDSAGWTNSINGAEIHNLPLENSYDGYSNWYVIAGTSTQTASTLELRLTPSSGSAPTN